MSNIFLNPFHVQKYFAQNIITDIYEPGGKYEIFTNGIYISVYLLCFFISLLTNDNITGEVRYNFISQMRFCMQFYFCGILFIQVTTMMTFFRKKYVNIYHALINHSRELKKINIYTEIKLFPIIIMYVIVFTTAFPVLLYDLYSFSDRYNITFFVCHYLPSLAIAVYIIAISTLMRICTSKFVSINNFLGTLTRDELSPLEKYYANRQNETPKSLLDLFPGKTYTIYEKLFMLHDEVTEAARTINKMCGYDLLMYMIIVTIDILSFIYDICMDITLYVKGTKLPPRTIYAIEYWSVMTVMGVAALITSSTGLMDNANDTKTYLHKLRNIYPKLNEHMELFSLQLCHSELQITAARFFTIHRGIIYSLVSAWITYIIIFMQLDTDISTVEAD